MSLTLEQKSAVRLHLAYPVIGLARTSTGSGTLASGAAGYRYHEAYGFLEWRLNNLSAEEEARLIGSFYGAVAIIGPQSAPLSSVSVTVTGGGLTSPQTLTATIPSGGGGTDTNLQFVLGLAAAAAANPVCQVAGLYVVAPYGTGAFSENAVPFPEVGFLGSSAFTLAATSSGAAVTPAITLQGTQLLDPQTSLDGVNTLSGYLPILHGLKGAFYTSSQNADTSQAGPWKARNSEMAHRISLYVRARQDLSDYIGIPINPRVLNRYWTSGVMRFA